MYIFEVGAYDRVHIKCKIPEFTHSKKNVTTTFTPKYWIWLNVDSEDSRGLSHKSACLRPFTPDWEYCKTYSLKNLTEHQLRLKSAESGKVFDVTPISSRNRQIPSNKTS